MTTRALIIVDVQNDFCEGGALAVAGGAEIASAISEHLDLHHGDYAAVAVTQDWHVDPGGHFSDTPDHRTSWPVHCVAGTPGAQLHENLDTEYVDAWFTKGEHEAAYSGFEGLKAPDESVPVGERETSPAQERTSLDDWLSGHGVETVDVVGLATDHCVKATALDAVDAGYDTRVLVALCAGIGEETVEQALEEMTAAGVEVLS